MTVLKSRSKDHSYEGQNLETIRLEAVNGVFDPFHSPEIGPFRPHPPMAILARL